MNSIEEIIEPYIEQETNVRELMQQLCSETCGLCTACCCRADICEEVTDSAFLSLLLKHQGISTDDMDDRYGWLAQDGCTLEYGRPPICYAYFCDELLDRISDETAQWVIQVLGRLIFHVGEDAGAGCHLTEIGTAAGLSNVNTETLLERIEQAQQAVEHIQQFIATGRLGTSGRELLQAIPMEEL